MATLLLDLFIILSPAFLCGSIGVYIFNNKLAQRKKEVEEGGHIQFDISKSRYLLSAFILPFAFGTIIGLCLLSSDPTIFLALLPGFIFSICVSVLSIKLFPLCFFTDKHLYLYPYMGLSPKCQKHELEKLRWKEEKTIRGDTFLIAYNKDKRISKRILGLYGKKEQERIRKTLRCR